ncbi:hypothetical protein Pfo_016568 [Paulownia fortunei]|nr:hypothetical protein Pfo_016568 [Paulownia fortunei]
MQAALLSPPSSSFIPITRVKFLGYNSRTTATIKNQQHQHQHQHQHQLSVDHRHIDMAASSSSVGTAPKWAQKTITIPAQRRGCHLITSKILKEIGQDLSGFKCGLAHLFLQHTSASLTVNENYDSDVRDDTETFLNRVVPEGRSAPWKHTLEGPDDMPAHIKSSMFGCSLTIPITDGKLNMGTWQGIWLCEHRDAATPRRVVITLNGI